MNLPAFLKRPIRPEVFPRVDFYLFVAFQTFIFIGVFGFMEPSFMLTSFVTPMLCTVTSITSCAVKTYRLHAKGHTMDDEAYRTLSDQSARDWIWAAMLGVTAVVWFTIIRGIVSTWPR